MFTGVFRLSVMIVSRVILLCNHFYKNRYYTQIQVPVFVNSAVQCFRHIEWYVEFCRAEFSYIA